jgi:hypothetical protein
LNPLVLVVGGVALLGGGYLVYKFVQASSPINQIENVASTATSALSKDPLSVVSLYDSGKGYVSTGVDDVGSGTNSVIHSIEGWL